MGPVGTVVLVEGRSDRCAVETLAARLGLDLATARVAVVDMGGATNVARCLVELGPHGRGLRTLGLYDAAEERFVRRGLARAGLGTPETRSDLEAAGFFACEADLEEELIRALGLDAVLAVVEARGDLASFRILQRQPAQADRSDEQRMRRFLGTTSGRKIEYAGLLAAALDLTALPRPLGLLLERMAGRP
jgi:hypothetical protein